LCQVEIVPSATDSGKVGALISMDMFFPFVLAQLAAEGLSAAG